MESRLIRDESLREGRFVVRGAENENVAINKQEALACLSLLNEPIW